MFDSIGWGEIFVLALAALFIFGPERLPDLRRGGLDADEADRARRLAVGVGVDGVLDGRDGEVEPLAVAVDGEDDRFAGIAADHRLHPLPADVGLLGDRLAVQGHHRVTRLEPGLDGGAARREGAAGGAGLAALSLVVDGEGARVLRRGGRRQDRHFGADGRELAKSLETASIVATRRRSGATNLRVAATWI